MIRIDIVLAEALQVWRGLLRRPSYLALAVFTLALGVSTTSLVFSLVDQALLTRLPYSGEDRLITLGIQIDERQNLGAPGLYAPARELKSLDKVGMVMIYTANANVASGETVEVVSSLGADRGFLDTLGMPLALGRNFNADEDRPNGPKAAIISHEFWQRRFGADASAIDRTLRIEGEDVRIIGVLPQNFEWPDRFDLLLSLQPDLANRNLSTNQYLVGRMRANVTLSGASAEAEARFRNEVSSHVDMSPEGKRYWNESRIGALQLRDSVFAARSGSALWLFFGAALCVLLVSAINLSNLMLLRALARSHDSSVRAALGAPLLRLALPSLAEGALIGLLGAIFGVALTWLGLRLLADVVPVDWIRGHAVSLRGGSVAFAFAVGVAVALLAAVLGALRGQRLDLVRELVGGGRSGLSRSAGRLGRMLVVAQIAVAVVLLVGAALFARSVQTLASVPMGFNSDAVTTFALAPVKSLYPDRAAVMQQAERIEEALRAIPGVEKAGMSTNLPTNSQLNVTVSFADGREINMQYRPVTPEFLSVFDIPLLSGRSLETGDRAGAEAICVVSAEFARAYLQNDAIGKIVTLPDDGASKPFPMRVVGVVGDVRQFGPSEPAPAIVYVPFAQMPDPLWGILREFYPLNYAAKLRPGASTGVEERLRDAVRRAAPQQPISGLQPMQTVVAETTRQQKLNLLLVGLFAGLALVLAAVGLYSTMSVTVAARRHEFGVRAALGAQPSRLLKLVLRESGMQVLIGLGIGLAAALALSRVMERFLFGIGAADPLAVVVVLLVLGTAGLVASLVPALRASRVPPMQALRME